MGEDYFLSMIWIHHLTMWQRPADAGRGASAGQPQSPAVSARGAAHSG